MKENLERLTREQAMDILQVTSCIFMRMRDKLGVIPYHIRKSRNGFETKYYLRHEIEALIALPRNLQHLTACENAQDETQNDGSSNIYSFDTNTSIRIRMIDGDPWFVAKDVCDALSISNNRDAMYNLDKDEKLTSVVPTPGQNRRMWFVNESGLYSLIFQSRKPEAKAFRKWVTSEVLPSLRKTGRYSTMSDTGRSSEGRQIGEYYITATRDIFS